MKIISVSMKNFLIIPSSEIELSPYFNVVTGETGSGKSLFVSVFKMLQGDKGSGNMAGKWGDRGEIAALIEIEDTDEELKANLLNLDIEPEDHNKLLFRRITGSRNTCYINGTMVSSKTFETLTGELIEISSQFENRELFKKSYQLKIVDQYCGSQNKLEEYRNLYNKYHSLKKEIEALKAKDDPAHREYLEYQVNEIENIAPEENEETELEEKVTLSENRENIIRYLQTISESFSHINSGLSAASRAASPLARLINSKELDERIESLLIEAEDIEKAVYEKISTFDTEEIDENSKERLGKINSLLMKHSVGTAKELLEKFSKMKKELDDLYETPFKIEINTGKIAKIVPELEAKAAELTSKREKAAEILSKEIETMLKRFGMRGVRFEAQVLAAEDFTETGKDDITFVVNTIGSEELYSIKKLSGGELSRLLLAFKLIDNSKGKFILFDEIDSNIGGETASIAAAELAETSKRNQIIVVTHFPQTAAAADRHFVVRKSSSDEISSEIAIPEHEERYEELARMMGDSNSRQNRLAAKDLIDKNKCK